MRQRHTPEISPATKAHYERLYDGVDGVIEILEAPEGKPLIDGGRRRKSPTRPARRFTRDGPTELVAGLPSQVVRALRLCLMIAVGVLPRTPDRARGRRGYLPGRAVWFDADLYAMEAQPGSATPTSVEELARRRTLGQQRLRRKLSLLGLPPSTIVDSGWGYHLYWYLDEPTEPATVVAANKAVADALGSTDSTWDAGRMLRAPGSWNLKVAEQHKMVRITRFRGDLTYDAADLRSAATKFAPSRDRLPVSDPGSRVVTAREPLVRSSQAIPPPIARILDEDPVARDLFDGRGKTRGDTSDSGYDMSLVLHLARRCETAVTADMLADTLLWRPRRRTRDLSYARKTVERALKWLDDHAPPLIGEACAGPRGAPTIGRGSRQTDGGTDVQ